MFDPSQLNPVSSITSDNPTLHVHGLIVATRYGFTTYPLSRHGAKIVNSDKIVTRLYRLGDNLSTCVIMLTTWLMSNCILSRDFGMNLRRDSFRPCVLSTMTSFIAIHSVGPVGEKFANKLVGVGDIIYSILLAVGGKTCGGIREGWPGIEIKLVWKSDRPGHVEPEIMERWQG